MWKVSIFKTIVKVFLVISAVVNIVPGLIHQYKDDGGSHSIAGLDISGQPDTVIAVYATFGFNQLEYGIVLIFIFFHLQSKHYVRLAFINWLPEIWKIIWSQSDFKPLGKYAPDAPAHTGLPFFFVVATILLIASYCVSDDDINDEDDEKALDSKDVQGQPLYFGTNEFKVFKYIFRNNSK